MRRESGIKADADAEKREEDVARPKGGRPKKKAEQKNQYTNMACDKLVLNVLKPPGLDDASDLGTVALRELPLCRVIGKREWQIEDKARNSDRHSRGKDLNLNRKVGKGVVAVEYMLVSLKHLPVRVAKYDVNLRDAPLRAVQAMHTILSRMVLFTCNDCKERFPTFHPAYVPPPGIAKKMEILKPGRDGVPVCSVEVATWDELPPLDAPDDLAVCCSGTCLRCQ